MMLFIILGSVNSWFVRSPEMWRLVPTWTVTALIRTRAPNQVPVARGKLGVSLLYLAAVANQLVREAVNGGPTALFGWFA